MTLANVLMGDYDATRILIGKTLHRKGRRNGCAACQGRYRALGLLSTMACVERVTPTASPEARSQRFVVRSSGTWWSTPIPGDHPVEIGLAGLVDLIQLHARTCASPATEVARTTFAMSVDRSGAAGRDWDKDPNDGPDLVGSVSADGVVIADAAGAPFTLTLSDLSALEGLSGPLALGSMSQRDRDRFRRLVDLGLVQICSDEAVSDGPGGLPLEEIPEGQSLVATAPPALAESLAPRRKRRLVTQRRRERSAKQRQFGRAGSPVSPKDPPDDEIVPATPEPTGVPDASGPDGRVPIYTIWHEGVGPLLSLGMLTAAARNHEGGVLNGIYEIRRPETAESFLADLAGRSGPGILLCSDYVWSLEANLKSARKAREISADLLVIHGGPSCPKYEGDAERFLYEHASIADILVRGEGEATLCALLEALGASPNMGCDALGTVDGITFRHSRTGATIRTPDRPRITDLDRLPSPYLTGEFDHIPASAWQFCMSVETNRGCPYGCTFCDWGSATLSRIRKFDLDRVTREVEWGAARGVVTIDICDANFGIMSRDVEVAKSIAAAKVHTGYPEAVIYCPAKNTTRHLTRIMDTFSDSSISSIAALALQTTDPETLAVLNRSNISVDAYVDLAACHRRRGHMVQGDLLLGMPGQTYESYRRDLQFMLDHEILARTWPVQILPNAPMNDPEYRERYQICSDEDNMVVSTASFTEADRIRMLRLRKLAIILEQFGLLRHVLRWLQWDRGLEATRIMDHVLDVVDQTPERFPYLTWIVGYFDLFGTAPQGWNGFYEDVRHLLLEDYGVENSTGFQCVFELNQFLMPMAGRSFPASIELPHNYVAYYRSATTDLYLTGHSGAPEHSLEEYEASSFVVSGDPLGLCTGGLQFNGDSRELLMQGDFYLCTATANELLSPLVRLLPHVIRTLGPDQVTSLLAEMMGPEGEAALSIGFPQDVASPGHIPVSVRGGRRQIPLGVD